MSLSSISRQETVNSRREASFSKLFHPFNFSRVDNVLRAFYLDSIDRVQR